MFVFFFQLFFCFTSYTVGPGIAHRIACFSPFVFCLGISFLGVGNRAFLKKSKNLPGNKTRMCLYRTLCLSTRCRQIFPSTRRSGFCILLVCREHLLGNSTEGVCSLALLRGIQSSYARCFVSSFDISDASVDWCTHPSDSPTPRPRLSNAETENSLPEAVKMKRNMNIFACFVCRSFESASLSSLTPLEPRHPSLC